MYRLDWEIPKTYEKCLNIYSKEINQMSQHIGLLIDDYSNKGCKLSNNLYAFIGNFNKENFEVIINFKGQYLFQFSYQKFLGNSYIYVSCIYEKESKLKQHIFDGRMNVNNLEEITFIENEYFSRAEFDIIFPKIIVLLLKKFEIRLANYNQKLELANQEKIRQENIVKERYKNLKTDLINTLK